VMYSYDEKKSKVVFNYCLGIKKER
jgi:hypothetical protein